LLLLYFGQINDDDDDDDDDSGLGASLCSLMPAASSSDSDVGEIQLNKKSGHTKQYIGLSG